MMEHEEHFNNLERLGIATSRTDAFYRLSYPALIALARKVEDDDAGLGVIAMCCAVYGWMPRIPTSIKCDSVIAAKVRAISDATAAENYIKSLGGVAPIGNSWVGTSKLLHFLNPTWFPIWDKRIARRRGYQHRHQFDKAQALEEYTRWCHNFLAENKGLVPKFRKKFPDLIAAESTDLRVLEFLLFSNHK